MKLDTVIAHAGLCGENDKGAISTPIYQTSTFRHPALGQTTGFDYSRTSNPTRKVLEESIAALEGGERGFAFSTGLAAVTAVLMLFKSGDHIIFSDDLYGGTYRLLDKVFNQFGLTASFVDTTSLENLQKNFREGSTKAVFVESPTNPLLKISDLRKIAEFAHKNNLLCIVDNTIMTPLLQQPLSLGADIVVHSGTKFLGGHNDTLAGLLVAKGFDLCTKLDFLQNATGGVLSPFDSWLIIRGIKTLSVRMQRSQENAAEIACWLSSRKEVSKVYYPGLKDHNNSEIHKAQARGAGAMISFAVKDKAFVEKLINSVKVISFAESLGGIETLITYPVKQTHADIPAELRDRVGITDDLLRLSVGIEDVNDLIQDLKQAFENEK